jgi:hypothetical protein
LGVFLIAPLFRRRSFIRRQPPPPRTSQMTIATPAPAGARTHAPPKLEPPDLVAEFPLNPFESFVATISTRPNGQKVCAITRVKYTPDGLRRMAVLEFGSHRLLAVSSLIEELMRAIATRGER